MTKITRSPLLALAALVVASAADPAMAGDWQSGCIPLGMPSNTLSANNIATGKGNTAVQNIQSIQAGGGFSGPRLLRAGGFNQAGQNIQAIQPKTSAGGLSLRPCDP